MTVAAFGESRSHASIIVSMDASERLTFEPASPTLPRVDRGARTAHRLLIRARRHRAEPAWRADAPGAGSGAGA